MMCEALIFQPQSLGNALDRNAIHRLKLFAAGRIEELHAEMMARLHAKPMT